MDAEPGTARRAPPRNRAVNASVGGTLFGADARLSKTIRVVSTFGTRQAFALNMQTRAGYCERVGTIECAALRGLPGTAQCLRLLRPKFITGSARATLTGKKSCTAISDKYF